MKKDNFVITTQLNGAPLKWFLEVKDYKNINFKVYYLTRGGFDTTLFDEFTQRGIPVEALSLRAIWKAYSEKPSILCIDFRSFFIASILLRGRLIYCIQGFKSAFRTRVKFSFLVISLLRNVIIRAASKALHEAISKEFAFKSAKKVITLPPYPKSQMFTSFKYRLNHNVVGVIANFYDEVKGAKFLIDVALSTEKIEKYEIFGNAGLLKDEIQSRTLSDREKLNRLIILNGHASHDLIFRNDFGIGFVPSKSEGFGRSACEFICNYRLLVSTKNGGIADIFPSPHENDFLIEYGDVKSTKYVLDRIAQSNLDDLKQMKAVQFSALENTKKRFLTANYEYVFYT